MEEIFRLEYHPIDDSPRRIRFRLQGGSNRIERVTERLTEGEWEPVDLEVIDYFEYSDE